MSFATPLKALQLSIVLAASHLVACGSSSGGGETTTSQIDESIPRSGIVKISSHNRRAIGSNTPFDEGFFEISAEFLESNEAVDLDATLSSTYDITADACSVIDETVFDINTLDIDPFATEDIPLNSITLNAGEAINILTPAGSWPDLLLNSYPYFDDYIHSYAYPAGVTENSDSIPENSILNIPGDEFPAFDSVAIPHIQPLAHMDVSNLRDVDVLSVDSVLTWVSAGNSDSTIPMYLTGVLQTASRATAESGIFQEYSFTCEIIDDGEFNFVENVVWFINRHELSIQKLSLSRRAFNTDTRGSANVVVFNESVYKLF